MTEVVTGEAVVLDLAVARFPNRIVAQLIDILVQLPVLLFLEIVIVKNIEHHLNKASAAALYIIAFALVTIAYPTTFETLSRGKTLGKLAMGIRVVSDDGGPERLRQALIRALSAGLLEIWGFPFNVIGIPAGLITSMVSARGKRLGDMFAGTFVIQERVPKRPDLAPDFAMIAPPLLEWSRHLEMSRLPDQTAAMVSSYLRRYSALRPAARAQIGAQLAATVASHVSPPPPPGTPAEAYLAAVLAVRRQRELARAQPGTAIPGFAPQPNYPPQPGYGQRPGYSPQPAYGPRGTVPVTDVSAIGQSAAPGTDEGGPTEPVDRTDQWASESPPEDYGFATPR
jgi:uncharacterized RDD family membrane protein YckC